MLKGYVPGDVLRLPEAGPESRERLYTKSNTFHAFLQQVWSEDGSCQEAVHRVIEQAQAQGIKTLPSASTSAYVQARSRLPVEDLEKILYHGAGVMEADAARPAEMARPARRRWRGPGLSWMEPASAGGHSGRPGDRKAQLQEFFASGPNLGEAVSRPAGIQRAAQTNDAQKHRQHSGSRPAKPRRTACEKGEAQESKIDDRTPRRPAGKTLQKPSGMNPHANPLILVPFRADPFSLLWPAG